jgi:hypothetical protein
MSETKQMIYKILIYLIIILFITFNVGTFIISGNRLSNLQRIIFSVIYTIIIWYYLFHLLAKFDLPRGFFWFLYTPVLANFYMYWPEDKNYHRFYLSFLLGHFIFCCVAMRFQIIISNITSKHKEKIIVIYAIIYLIIYSTSLKLFV